MKKIDINIKPVAKIIIPSQVKYKEWTIHIRKYDDLPNGEVHFNFLGRKKFTHKGYMIEGTMTYNAELKKALKRFKALLDSYVRGHPSFSIIKENNV